MIKPPSTVTHPKIMGSHRWFPFLKVYWYLVPHTCSCLCVCTQLLIICLVHLYVELHWCHWWHTCVGKGA
jgi:hypothetical protein